MSIEQMCRDLLTQAIKDGLVLEAEWQCEGSEKDWFDPNPQERSAGELTGMANMLNDILAKEIRGFLEIQQAREQSK